MDYRKVFCFAYKALFTSVMVTAFAVIPCQKAFANEGLPTIDIALPKIQVQTPVVNATNNTKNKKIDELNTSNNINNIKTSKVASSTTNMQEKTKAKARVVASESSQLPSLDFGIKSTKKQEQVKNTQPLVKPMVTNTTKPKVKEQKQQVIAETKTVQPSLIETKPKIVPALKSATVKVEPKNKVQPLLTKNQNEEKTKVDPVKVKQPEIAPVQAQQVLPNLSQGIAHTKVDPQNKVTTQTTIEPSALPKVVSSEVDSDKEILSLQNNQEQIELVDDFETSRKRHETEPVTTKKPFKETPIKATMANTNGSVTTTTTNKVATSTTTVVNAPLNLDDDDLLAPAQADEISANKQTTQETLEEDQDLLTQASDYLFGGVPSVALPNAVKRSLEANNVVYSTQTPVDDSTGTKLVSKFGGQGKISQGGVIPDNTGNTKTQFQFEAKHAQAFAQINQTTKKGDLSAFNNVTDKLNLPRITQVFEHNLSLDQANGKRYQGNNGNGPKNEDGQAVCTLDLPCLPMYGKYMLKLDEENDFQHFTVANSEDLTAPKKPQSSLALPVLAQYDARFLALDKDAQKKQALKNGAKTQKDYIIEKMREQGIIIVRVDNDPTKPKLKSEEDLKVASTDDLINEEEKLYKFIGVTGEFVRNYSQAQDKKEFIQSLALNKVNGVINENLDKYLEAYDGVNAEITARISFKDSSLEIEPDGKVLVPLYSVPKFLTYMQGGITTGTESRKIAHLGIGERFYPQAVDMKDLGHHMIGLNFVVDHDLDRGHTRGSIGIEYMQDNLKVIANIYRRLSSWRDSEEFEKGYVEERPASGWDIFVEYWVKAKFAVEAGLTHWIGRDISPFGGVTDEKDLEDSPYIAEVGVKYNPFPAISLEAKHQQSLKTGSHKNTYFGLNFNIPLGDNFSWQQAFDPDATNRASGSNIATSRSMFIKRDYTMPLQYRAKPGVYYIYFEKGLGDNKYLFRVEDGLHRPAPYVPVHVTPHHPSVELSNGGNYITDGTGHFIIEIIQSCVPEVDVTVQVGNTTIDFHLKVDKMSFEIKSEPSTIERWITSNVTLYIPDEIIAKGGSFDFLQKGLQVEWSVDGGDENGKVSEATVTMTSDGKSTVVFTPNVARTETYNATVIATIPEYNASYKTNVEVKIWGARTTDLTTSSASIDGGQYATITYKNLRPSTVDNPNSVDFNVKSGACRVENTQPADVTPLTNANIGNTVTANVDDQGVATAYVIGSTDANTTGNCIVTAKTEDPYLNEPHREKPQAVVANNVYDAVWSQVPTVVFYEDPFLVELDKLKDDTRVTFGIDNNSAQVETIAGFALRPRMRLARAPNNAFATNTVLAKNKKASSEYLVTGDHSISIVEGVQATYYHDAYNTHAPIDLSVYFNGQGSGDTGLEIKHVEPMVLSTQGLANSGSMTPSDLKVLDTKLNSRSLPTYSGINSSGVTQYNGTDTMDYKTNYGYEFDGLLPNTDVTVTATNTTLSGVDADGNAVRSANSLKLHVDNDGKIKFGVNQVTDYNVKDINLKIAYQENYKGTVLTEKDFKVNLYQYPLQMTTDKDEIVADDSFVATVSGGKPGERVSWTLESGDGEIVSKDEVFNSNGVACATLAGTYPFKKLININADSASYIAQADCQPKFDFVISFSATNSVWNKGSYQTYTVINNNYKIAGVKYISSVHVESWGRVDDGVVILLNDVGYLAQNIGYCGNKHYWDWRHVEMYLNSEQLKDFKDSVKANNNIVNVKLNLSDWCGGDIALQDYGLKVTIEFGNNV